MRLLSARLRDYRLHRDLSVNFDPRFTVISGPNQSGKSTLAEALHRALFLPVKTGGAVLEGMRTDPFLADPEVELAFDCGGDSLDAAQALRRHPRQRALQDSGGRSLQGDAAEERLAELIGTAAVARNRGAADQLRERWGHLWVWQGSASDNPLDAQHVPTTTTGWWSGCRPVPTWACNRALDLAVLDDIQTRWAAVFTPGSATRAPQAAPGLRPASRPASRAAAGPGGAGTPSQADCSNSSEAQQAFEQAATGSGAHGQRTAAARQQTPGAGEDPAGAQPGAAGADRPGRVPCWQGSGSTSSRARATSSSSHEQSNGVIAELEQAARPSKARNCNTCRSSCRR